MTRLRHKIQHSRVKDKTEERSSRATLQEGGEATVSHVKGRCPASPCIVASPCACVCSLAALSVLLFRWRQWYFSSTNHQPWWQVKCRSAASQHAFCQHSALLQWLCVLPGGMCVLLLRGRHCSPLISEASQVPPPRF